MSIQRYSEGCFRLQGRTLDRDAIDGLIVEAGKTELRRARICVHYDENDPIQEMFVLMLKDSYKGTYKYNKAVSLFLMHGEFNITFVTQGGEELETVSMNSRQPFIKIEAGTYHRPKLHSDYVLLHEIHAGPWSKKEFLHPIELRGMSG